MEAVPTGEVTLAIGRRTQICRSVSRYKRAFSLLVGCAFLTHGSAGVMVIAANRDFATLLAESIDYNDQPIVLE